MRFKHIVSRQLNKRMSHNFTQAHLATDYSITLSVMLRDFGLTTYEYMRDNLRHVKKALDEMIQKRVIRSYSIKEIYDTERKNKLVDALIILKSDLDFAHQTIKANVKQKNVRLLIGNKKG